MSALEMLDWAKERPGVSEAKEAVLPFPDDVVERATRICKEVGSLGAYTPTKGVPAIRQAIARFIQERDQRPEQVDPENVFLTNGASDGINRVLKLIAAHDQVGVLVPVPQYPLYSATLTLLGAKLVPYCLDEDNNWSLAPDELGGAIRRARMEGLDVRAMVMINPGNPIGNVFDRRTLEAIVRTCAQERLVLLADEVYQANVYAEKPFLSARRVALELGLALELFSFHSTSKGLLGECSRRGGYFEAHGIDGDVLTQLLKLSSMSLSSNVTGQVMMGLLVDPPREGQASYPVYKHEIDTIYESLKRRGAMLADAFNRLEGVTCNPAEVKLHCSSRMMHRAQCTCFRASSFPPSSSRRQRQRESTPRTCTASPCSSRPESAWCPGGALARRRERIMCAPRFSLPSPKCGPLWSRLGSFIATFTPSTSKIIQLFARSGEMPRRHLAILASQCLQLMLQRRGQAACLNWACKRLAQCDNPGPAS